MINDHNHIDKKNNSPILVTGTHRAGTTWVGRMLAFSKDIGYISEPFTLHHRPGIFNYEINYWFQYICSENSTNLVEPFQDMLDFNYKLMAEIKALKKPIDIPRMIRDITIFNMNKIHKKRPLVKESLAFFSAPWIASEFESDILTLIRHPAAFIASLKKGNTNFSFKNFLLQERLMEEVLHPFKLNIEKYSKRNNSIIEQGILLWNIIHYTISQYKKIYPNWLYYRHEDISLDPINNFKEIYKKLNLNWTPDIEKNIHTYCFPHKIKDDKKISGSEIKRNSQSTIKQWKKRLSKDEINLIRKETFEISSLFYKNTEW